MRATVRLQREYRVAIPPAIRESLGLEIGEIVEIDVQRVGILENRRTTLDEVGDREVENEEGVDDEEANDE